MPLASQARSSKAKAQRDANPSYSNKRLPSSVPSTTKESKARNLGRKPVQLLDTNINSYDRTDPFFAFNTLIKLLGSLPSRIGGCQFKFTPDEHKLSLHLLSIVEPFVGLTASRRSITRQPTEILDSIIFHIPSRRDLLSLALSCHRMYDVVFPRHYSYRHIRCRVSSISVWNHLVVNRSLARNVRRLEILDERSNEAELAPPGILVSDTDLDSTDDELALHDKQERYFVSALNKMIALGSFSWSCNHSPISIDNVWPTLLKCHSLNEVEINDNLVFSAIPSINTEGGESRPQRKPTVLTSMTTVSMRSTTHAYGASKQPNLSRVSSILNHCPNLQSLDVTYKLPRSSAFHNQAHPPALGAPGTAAGGGIARPQADDLLLSGRWPLLTSLTLTNLRCSPAGGFDSTATFLFSHPNLESVHLDLGIAGSSSRLLLPPGTLPRLKELHANKEVVNAVLGCPCDSPRPRPLETLRGFRLSGPTSSSSSSSTPTPSLTGTHGSGPSPGGRTASDIELLTNLRLSNLSCSIKRIELTGWNDMDDIRKLIECAPGLTWFDVGRKTGTASALHYHQHCPLPTTSNHTHQQQQHGFTLGPGGTSSSSSTAGNIIEWATLLSALPDLAAFHGIKFFYEVSPQAALPGVVATSTSISMADRSRIRKNDEVAAVLAWKCPRLRRVDHWEEGGGKVVVLSREREVQPSGHGAAGEKEKVKWEVRRVKV